jgi:hypothetical protein
VQNSEVGNGLYECCYEKKKNVIAGLKIKKRAVLRNAKNFVGNCDSVLGNNCLAVTLCSILLSCRQNTGC